MKSFRKIMDENNTTIVDCEKSLKMKKPKFGWDNRSFMLGGKIYKNTLRRKQVTTLKKKQLTNKWENMKKEWKLYDRLMRLETGLGGTRSLNKDYAKYRNTNLSIFDEKYATLFRDSVSIGDQTMTPLQFQNNSNPNEESMEGKGDSDEINLDDDEPLFTSLQESSSSKRKRSKSVSNNRPTKSKSSIDEEKVDALLDAILSKSTQTYPQNNPSPTIAYCMAIDIKGPTNFHKHCLSSPKSKIVMLLCSQRTTKPRWSFLRWIVMIIIHPMIMKNVKWKRIDNLKSLKGIILARNLRTPCHTSDRTGHILNVPVFRQLCIDLATNYGLQQTRKVFIEESVGIFLMTLAHGSSNRFVQEFFNHSGETIHRNFHIVLEVVLKLSADIIKPDANYNDDVPRYILNKLRYYPMFIFLDCIGAIDGIHVKASVPLKDEVKYIGRKGYATQNIMIVCDFNMCFTFVWEGTAHDTKIFNEALQRPDLNFPYPTDKYYVLMLDIQIREGILLHTKVQIFVIIYQIFDVDTRLLFVNLMDRKRNLTISTHHCEISLNELLECEKLSGPFNRALQESYNPVRDDTGSDVYEEGSSTHHTSDDDLYMAAIRDIIAQDIITLRR
uniref:DUF8040 domain-containing protein n=1 Tax=Lactuca sativa TaxID=4236 RepID=A0A9R1UWN7_LACSA|nr:hypothetical protein LSAT_V11C800435240 [Lactuca sativa]